MFNQISVILFVLKDGDLRKSIESVLNQFFKNFELIIIDSENSEELISDYIVNNEKVRYFKTKFEKITEGFNFGLAVSRGDYISFLTSSDYLYPQAFRSLYNPNMSVIYGTVTVRGANINPYGRFDLKLNNLLNRKMIHLSSALIKKEILNIVGAFNVDLEDKYDMDLWQRIAKSEPTFEKILTLISEIDWSGSSSEQIILKNKYPLQNFWDERRSVAYYGDEPFLHYLVDSINIRQYPWVAVEAFGGADLFIVSEYSNVLDNYEGDIIYYPRSVELDPKMLELCCGIIAHFPITTDKPFFLQRPAISASILREVKSYPRIPFDDLRIAFLGIKNNLDFFYLAVENICKNFKNVTIVYKSDPEIAYKLKEKVQDVRCLPLENFNSESLRQANVWALVSTAAYEDYNSAYEAFGLSIKCKAPLIAPENIVYKDLLNNENQILTYVTIQDIMRGLERLKVREFRENLITNSILVAYTDFLNEVVLDKLMFFWHSVFVPSNPIIQNYLIDTAQMESNMRISLGGNTLYKQSFYCNHNNLSMIEIFINVTSNNSKGMLELTIFENKDPLRVISLDNYQLKNGSNIFTFTPILDSKDKELIFTLYSENQICGIECIDRICSVGNFWIDEEPKKMCLKFRAFYG